MRSVILLILIGSSFQVKAQTWTPLFNGHSLEGWEHVGEGKFKIEDSMLVTSGGMGLLYYAEQPMADCIIRVVYRGDRDNNAGVFIRIPEKPTEPWMPVNRGYEVQIDDRGDEYHCTGSLYSLTKVMARPSKPGEWNVMEITLDGDRTLVTINGVLVTYFREGDPVPAKTLSYEPERGPRPAEGYFGLQNHGGDDVIYFKEVSYRKRLQ